MSSREVGVQPLVESPMLRLNDGISVSRKEEGECDIAGAYLGHAAPECDPSIGGQGTLAINRIGYTRVGIAVDDGAQLGLDLPLDTP